MSEFFATCFNKLGEFNLGLTGQLFVPKQMLQPRSHPLTYLSSVQDAQAPPKNGHVAMDAFRNHRHEMLLASGSMLP
jgi:hypothetical protein